MKETKKFIKTKKEELNKKCSVLMVECMDLIHDETATSRLKHRDLIDAFLDLASYNDEWEEIDSLALATAVAHYLTLCHTLIKTNLTEDNREFVETTKVRLIQKSSTLMLDCMVSFAEQSVSSREMHRELIDTFLDLAMYYDEWDNSDNRVLATAIARYLTLCGSILKEER